MDKYICKECGAEASIGTGGAVERSCEHTGTVILQMEVVVTGEGGAANGEKAHGESR